MTAQVISNRISMIGLLSSWYCVLSEVCREECELLVCALFACAVGIWSQSPQVDVCKTLSDFGPVENPVNRRT